MLPEKEISLEMRKRLVKSFMDIIILRELKTRGALSGYDVIAYIHKKFDLLVSPGTAYALLYSMQRKGLIENTVESCKKVYKITEKGRKMLDSILRREEEIRHLVNSIFSK
jgi:DNA-binding PadR family transcriptional regulator